MGMVGSRGMRFVVMASVAAFLTVAAAGCGGTNATPQTTYISPPPGTLAPGATPTPSPRPPDITGEIISTTAPDSRWTVTFKKPVIGGVTPAVATKMNAAITAKVNGYISAFTSRALPAAGMRPAAARRAQANPHRSRGRHLAQTMPAGGSES